MIYHLLYPLSDQISILNVFRYITFRSVYAMLTALVLSIMIGPAFIEWLRRLRFGQYIKSCGPDHQSKSDTPTYLKKPIQKQKIMIMLVSTNQMVNFT